MHKETHKCTVLEVAYYRECRAVSMEGGTSRNHCPTGCGKQGSGLRSGAQTRAVEGSVAGVSAEAALRRLAPGNPFHQAEAGSQPEGEATGNKSVLVEIRFLHHLCGLKKTAREPRQQCRVVEHG